MRDPSNNNAVRINTNNENYTNSNTDEENIGTSRSRVIDPNNLRRMRRARMSFVNAGVVRRLNFGNNSNAPPSPGRKPKMVNTSKFEQMLKNLEKNNDNKNNTPNNANKNVSNWINNSGLASNKGKASIPKAKRSFLIVDVTDDGKIKHVYDRDYLEGIIKAWENGFNEKMGDRKLAKSPFTKRPFGKKDIRAYPPSPETKKLIAQLPLLAEAGNIDEIANLVKSGKITTVKQVKDFKQVFKVFGSHEFTRIYKQAFLQGKFKSHHIDALYNIPKMIAYLYDPMKQGIYARRNINYINSMTEPFYYLSPAEVRLIMKLDPYIKVAKENPRGRRSARETLILDHISLIKSKKGLFTKDTIMNTLKKVEDLKTNNKNVYKLLSSNIFRSKLNNFKPWTAKTKTNI